MNIEQFSQVIELLKDTEADVVWVAMAYVLARWLCPILFSVVVLYLGTKTLNLIGRAVQKQTREPCLSSDEIYRISDTVSHKLRLYLNGGCDGPDDRLYSAKTDDWWTWSPTNMWNSAEPPAGWVKENPPGDENPS